MDWVRWRHIITAEASPMRGSQRWGQWWCIAWIEWGDDTSSQLRHLLIRAWSFELSRYHALLHHNVLYYMCCTVRFITLDHYYEPAASTPHQSTSHNTITITSIVVCCIALNWVLCCMINVAPAEVFSRIARDNEDIYILESSFFLRPCCMIDPPRDTGRAESALARV